MLFGKRVEVSIWITFVGCIYLPYLLRIPAATAQLQCCLNGFAPAKNKYVIGQKAYLHTGLSNAAVTNGLSKIAALQNVCFKPAAHCKNVYCIKGQEYKVSILSVVFELALL
jgi:hypothetical protein